MAADRHSLGFKASSDLNQRVEDFREREGYDYKSEALEELTRIGLREARSPILYRAKEEFINWAGWMGATAIVVVILGLTTDIMAPGHGLLVAAIMSVVAFALVASAEIMRALQGQSEIGRLIREVKDA